MNIPTQILVGAAAGFIGHKTDAPLNNLFDGETICKLAHYATGFLMVGAIFALLNRQHKDPTHDQNLVDLILAAVFFGAGDLAGYAWDRMRTQ